MKQKNYPLYETTVFENFRVLTENAAKKFPDKAAVVYKKNPKDTEVVTKTFSMMRDDIRDFGTGMMELGVDNRHIAIIGESSYHWICAYFGLMACGAVTVPLDKELPAEDLAATCATAECTAVFYSPAISKKLPGIREALPADTLWVSMGESKEQPDDKTMDEIIARGAQLYADGDNSFYDYEIDNKRLATIVFTSGTTGKGKGVMLSQYNIVSDMTQGMYNFAITPSTLNVLPPHHTFGSTVNFVGHLSQGSTVYISSGIRYILSELKEQKPRHLVLVPLFVETFYKRIWNNAEKQGKAAALRKLMKFSNSLRRVGIDLRRTLFRPILANFGGNLEMIICGGAALNQDIIDTFDAMGITILNGYGITECAPLISYAGHEENRPGSCGRPTDNVEIMVDSPDPENVAGELLVRGANVMLGYYKNPEETEMALRDGWLHTGDICNVDSDGFIYIRGRNKNMILGPSGQNIYPEEIEQKLNNLPYVNESIVIERDGKIIALVHPDYDLAQSQGLTDDDIKKQMDDNIAALNKEIPAYSQVAAVEIHEEEFEKTPKRSIRRFLYK